MFFKNKKKTAQKTQPHSTNMDKCIEQLKTCLHDSSDFVIKTMKINNKRVLLAYLSEFIKDSSLNNHIIRHLNRVSQDELTYQCLRETLPVAKLSVTNQLPIISENIVRGHVYIFVDGDSAGILAEIGERATRAIDISLNESTIFGPKVSFTEEVSANLNLVRGRIDDPNLKVEKIIVGKRAKTSVYIVYISDIADIENVKTFKQRLEELDVDTIIDSSILSQQIEDNSLSIFPQFTVTELPDLLTTSLIHGKVGLLVDRSPTAIIGPATFLSFFESSEDIYVRWNMGTFLRFLRFTSIFLSVLLTPAYVAVLTFHYEVIPSALLNSLGESRANVPFPPVYEALIMEFVIEMLREAAARLPIKVGQSIGVVGGIVIGTAAVQAGFTSNILIIIIGLSAIGSFTAPSYIMGTTIRLIRFPIIVLAGLWGGVGIMFCFCFILIHLLRLTTLGRPYMSPVYPLRLRDWKYSLFRSPPQYYSMRPETNHPSDSQRIPLKKQKMKKDIDE
ncbi:spore germination protein [Bacillus spongiae]|uniref:Spore germination protein n=2 Tax=Bacillus spongiae TaxID=2683610 RepID=A0ABU8HIB4_9BACI